MLFPWSPGPRLASLALGEGQGSRGSKEEEENVMGNRSEASPVERKEAVLALLRGEEPAELIARRYGVSANTLYGWRDTFLQGGEASLANGQGKGDQNLRRIQELERELAERDRVIGELTIANRILKKNGGRRTLDEVMRSEILREMRERPGTRLTRVLRELGLGVTNWNRESIPQELRKRPGPPPEQVPLEMEKAVVEMATQNPWYGYKRIAVMCRRAGRAVTNRQAYKVMKRRRSSRRSRKPAGRRSGFMDL